MGDIAGEPSNSYTSVLQTFYETLAPVQFVLRVAGMFFAAT